MPERPFDPLLDDLRITLERQVRVNSDIDAMGKAFREPPQDRVIHAMQYLPQVVEIE